MVLLLTFSACANREHSGSTPIVNTTKETKKDVAYGGHCGMGLCLKKKVKGIEKYSLDYKGKTYLFSSEEAKAKFIKDIDKNIQIANKQYSRMEIGADKTR